MSTNIIESAILGAAIGKFHICSSLKGIKSLKLIYNLCSVDLNYNSLNTISIVLLCYRLVLIDWSIGKYVYGVKLKKHLLEHEGHDIEDNLFFN